jgi:ComF family protein
MERVYMRRHLESLRRLCRTVLEGVLDLVFPRSETLRSIEEMDASAFASAAAPASEEQERWRLSLFSYEDPLVSTAIRELKYRGNRRIAKLWGELVSEAIIGEMADEALFDAKKFVLVPLPLSPQRERERGFNQCALILSHLSPEARDLCEIRTDILEKIRHTESQTHLKRSDRLTNLAGSFGVRYPETVRGRHVVILDDVTTTGATFTEARRALLAAGAKKVTCVALAH